MLKQEASRVNGILSMEDLVTRRCEYCEATGEVDIGTFAEYHQPCPVCDESGKVRVPEDYTECRRCQDTGKENMGEYFEWFVPCEKCHGTGWAPPPPVYR